MVEALTKWRKFQLSGERSFLAWQMLYCVVEALAKQRMLQPSGRSSGQAGKLWSSGGSFSCSDKAFSCSRSFGRVGYFDQVVKFQLTRNFSTFYITFFKEEHVFSQYTGSNSFKYPIKCHRILTKGSDLSWTLSHHTRDILLHFYYSLSLHYTFLMSMVKETR